MSAYGKLCALFYDADKPHAPAAEVDWYAARLPRTAGPVLEPLCGSGRLLLPLVQRGFGVHGADASAAMLAQCEVRLAAAGLAAPLFRQDAAALNLPFRYAAAFVAAGSFQLLGDRGGAQAALERIRAHLVPPGLLLVDLFVPAIALHPPGAPLIEVRAVTRADGTRIVLRSETFVDVDGRRLETRGRYEHRAGPALLAREDEVLDLTWYDEDEAVTLLRDAGYRDIAVEPSPLPAEPGGDERRFALKASM
jgi:hypothetical protein